MAVADLRSGILGDIVFMGLRASVGIIFILHSFGKFNPGFLGFMNSLGFPAALQYPIGLMELVPGILMFVGILNRFSAAALSIVMLVAIFHVKGAGSIVGDRGVELDLILLAAALVIMIMGPGRISIAHAVKKIPRLLH